MNIIKLGSLLVVKTFSLTMERTIGMSNLYRSSDEKVIAGVCEGIGYSISLANGNIFSRSIVRDDFRRSLIRDITSSINDLQVDTLSYGYDALNRPVSRNSDAFGYNEHSKVIFSRGVAEDAEYSYDEIGNLVARSSASITNHYISNNLNQYTTILRDSATPREINPQCDIDGNLISKSGSLADFFRHRFSTKYFDAESNLYYYGYRFYHPTLMRWLNRDPIEENGGLNLYLACVNNVLSGIDVLGQNRYITQFDILNYGGSGGTQLHVGVAVDRWACRNGVWAKTGVVTFDFGVDVSLGWRNTMWSIIGIARGAIMERDGMHLKAPITLKSSPEQDVKMYNMIQKEIANPPFYNLLFHQCVFWSVGAINYGMQQN